jgi:hypothetical protein
MYCICFRFLRLKNRFGWESARVSRKAHVQGGTLAHDRQHGVIFGRDGELLGKPVLQMSARVRKPFRWIIQYDSART